MKNPKISAGLKQYYHRKRIESFGDGLNLLAQRVWEINGMLSSITVSKNLKPDVDCFPLSFHNAYETDYGLVIIRYE